MFFILKISLLYILIQKQIIQNRLTYIIYTLSSLDFSHFKKVKIASFSIIEI
jgi:hypothetical protein